MGRQRLPGSLRAMTPARTPVELHIVSDSTGETAARLVAALEAQFPEQPFEEIRHPQIQTIDDLQLAVNRAKGRSAVMVYTLVDREMREAMRTLCRSARLHYCDLLGHPIESIAKVSGMAAKMKAGARPPLNSAYFKRMEAIEFAVKFDDGVGSGLREADIVLVGVSRTSKTPLSIYLGYLGHKTANVPVVKGITPPKELFEIDAAKIAGLTIDAERLAEIRNDARPLDGGDEPPLRRAAGDLRGAGAGGGAAPPPGLPGRRRDRPLDRGDGSPRDPAARPAPAGDCGPVSTPAARRKPPVPRWRWALWLTILGAADLAFYVILTPIWLGLRGAAWLAEWRSRRKRLADPA